VRPATIDMGIEVAVAFGEGLTTAEPGSAQRFELVVADIDAARADLIERGVEVGDIFHSGPLVSSRGPTPNAPLPDVRVFADPDGNGWLLQEVTERAEGRA
jgi:hypothetical protein